MQAHSIMFCVLYILSENTTKVPVSMTLPILEITGENLSIFILLYSLLTMRTISAPGIMRAMAYGTAHTDAMRVYDK